jgi:hypothetical protein
VSRAYSSSRFPPLLSVSSSCCSIVPSSFILSRPCPHAFLSPCSHPIPCRYVVPSRTHISPSIPSCYYVVPPLIHSRARISSSCLVPTLCCIAFNPSSRRFIAHANYSYSFACTVYYYYSTSLI